nr:BCCT family transporter [Marinomonas sp. KJ51-3]
MEQTDNDKLKKSSKNRSLDYTTNYKAGQDNVRFLGFDIHNPVFSTSALLMAIFITFTLLMPSKANEILIASRTWVINNFDWFFMISVNAIVLFCIAIAASPLGKIRLGGDSSKAEFSTFSWYCMLFASGVGIGLLFWGVAEPVAYYTDWYGTPLNVEARTPEAKNLALSSALFHWGIHGWATFGIVGLALAFFSYNKGMPFTIRSAFYPILGEKCWGTMGNIIDILAAIATVFGLATSLGLGAQQAASGLNYLFNIPDTTTTQVIVIILITIITFFLLSEEWIKAFVF